MNKDINLAQDDVDSANIAIPTQHSNAMLAQGNATEPLIRLAKYLTSESATYLKGGSPYFISLLVKLIYFELNVIDACMLKSLAAFDKLRHYNGVADEDSIQWVNQYREDARKNATADDSISDYDMLNLWRQNNEKWLSSRLGINLNETSSGISSAGSEQEFELETSQISGNKDFLTAVVLGRIIGICALNITMTAAIVGADQSYVFSSVITDLLWPFIYANLASRADKNYIRKEINEFIEKSGLESVQGNVKAFKESCEVKFTATKANCGAKIAEAKAKISGIAGGIYEFINDCYDVAVNGTDVFGSKDIFIAGIAEGGDYF